MGTLTSLDPQHFQRLDQFLRRLPHLADAAALAAATAEVSAPLGLPTVMAGAIVIRGNQVGGQFYFGNWSRQWQSTYLESIFADDPLVHEARRRVSPFTWSELWAEGDLPPAVREIIAIGRQHGWTDGFAVPIHGPAGYMALVSFEGGKIELSSTDRSVLLALAHAAHQRGRALHEQGKGQAMQRLKLTRRELQAMHWVSRGKTDADIAAILKLSVATVHGYVEQAKRKLGVRSRSQAVSELVLQEMLLREK